MAPVAIRDFVSSIRAGVSAAVEDRPATSGEAAILKLSAIANGRLDVSHRKAVRSTAVALGPSLTAGTVLVSRSNTAALVGAATYVDTSHPTIHLPDLLWELQVASGSDTDARWLAYALQCPQSRKAIRRIAAGTSGSMKKLSMERFRGLRLPAGTPVTRAQTVQVLDLQSAAQNCVDDLRLAAAEFRRGCANLLLTGRQRFPEFTSQRWREVRLGEVFRERDERGGGDLPLMAITSDRGVIRREETDRRDSSAADKSRYKRIAPGDIGYNTMRMWQGVSGLSRLEGIVSPAYTVVTPTSEIVPEFAAHLFKLPRTINSFRRLSQGLVDDTLNLKYPQFAAVRVSIPGVSEQRQIARVLNALSDEIRMLAELGEALADQKRGLMDHILGDGGTP